MIFTPAILELDSTVVGIIAILAALVYLVFFLTLFFKDGQRFTNKYGEDPKAEPVEQTLIGSLVDKP